VLQAPLCVLACLPGEVPETWTAEASHAPPCHGAAPSSESSEPADSHDDCGCEDSLSAVLSNADPSFSNVQNSAVVQSKALDALVIVVCSSATKFPPSETDLPPPDILLLKSAFLI
jgi:hypothetical protein